MDNIYRMNEDGTGQVWLTTGTGYSRQPAWSPNGSKIAFVSNRDWNDEIYTMNADGTEVMRLTTTPALMASPPGAPNQEWCRDGRRGSVERGDGISAGLISLAASLPL